MRPRRVLSLPTQVTSAKVRGKPMNKGPVVRRDQLEPGTPVLLLPLPALMTLEATTMAEPVSRGPHPWRDNFLQGADHNLFLTSVITITESLGWKEFSRAIVSRVPWREFPPTRTYGRWSVIQSLLDGAQWGETLHVQGSHYTMGSHW